MIITNKKTNSEIMNRVARVFRLYKNLESFEDMLVHHRRGRFGISVSNDPDAVKYQQRIAWRKEVVDSFLSGRKPNPYVKRWYKP